jgi:Ca2+-binding EF-hand superfamily protein
MQSPWYIQEAELKKYISIFTSFDKANQGFLPAAQLRDIMDQTKMERPTCDRVF